MLYSMPPPFSPMVLAIAIAWGWAIAPSMARDRPYPLAQRVVPKLAQKPVQRTQSNPPPPPANPGSSAAGGRRNPAACPQDASAQDARPLLTALSPLDKSGMTLAEHPTFLVYLPKTSAQNAEFSLRLPNGSGVYRTIVPLPATAQLIRVTLPAASPSLVVGQSYTWSFAVICNPRDRLDDRFVTATVQRLAIAPTRHHQIQQASPKAQVALYQQADAWYDALATLFELKRTQPQDPDLDTPWQELLRSGGVDAMFEVR
jgi:hypothetical protein